MNESETFPRWNEPALKDGWSTRSTRDETSRLDGLLVVSVLLLLVGLVMVASATATPDRMWLDQQFFRSVAGRQMLFVLLGVVVMMGTTSAIPVLWSSVGRRRAFLWMAFLGVVSLLVMALVPGLGEARRGSQRWLILGPRSWGFGLQPSELAKPIMVAFIAGWAADRTGTIRSFRSGFLPVAAVVVLLVGLVGKEDFGSALVFAAVGGSMLLVAGCRWLHMGLLGLVGSVGMGFLLMMAPYRMARLTAYQDIWGDVRGGGYQPVQSLAAMAAGGWWGTGLGSGMQKHGYLPEAHSDFIYSIICEETGVLGGAVVLGLYVVLIGLGIRVVMAARSSFECLLAFGLTALIGTQAALNIAVTTVLAPTTGVSLPLISAGGSGALACCFSIGLLRATQRQGRASGRETAGHRTVPEWSSDGVRFMALDGMSGRGES